MVNTMTTPATIPIMAPNPSGGTDVEALEGVEGVEASVGAVTTTSTVVAVTPVRPLALRLATSEVENEDEDTAEAMADVLLTAD